MAGLKRVYVAGTCDTKGAELAFVAERIAAAGMPVAIVDLSTSGAVGDAEFTPQAIAAHHPKGAAAVFTGDRGSAVAAMALAFERFMGSLGDVAGLIGLGGSGGTALVTPAMRALPIGVPKLMVSTLAAGNVAPYVGPSDIAMLNAVTDVAGLNRISRRILSNAAHAMAGMAKAPVEPIGADKPALGLTMFGVTTPCVTRIAEALRETYECLVFHATGIGGQAMEKLADSGLLAGILDVTTTEVCDLLFGGILPATQDRLGAVRRTRLPYIGSCGALDMVNFGAIDTVPERYRSRRLYRHNPQITLMRTTPEENALLGRWIGERLNGCEGQVRFFLPEGGVSLLDAPGQPFWDPEADAALFAALEATLVRTERRQLVRLPYAINDPAFADALVASFRSLVTAA